MSDNEKAGARDPQGEELSDEQLEAVAGGGILEDLAATAAWLEEQARKKMQQIMDAANGGPPVS